MDHADVAPDGLAHPIGSRLGVPAELAIFLEMAAAPFLRVIDGTSNAPAQLD